VSCAPDQLAPSILGGDEEGPLAEPEQRIEGAVDDEGRAGITLEAGDEPLAHERIECRCTAARPETPGDERLGDRRSESPPEKAGVETIERGPVADAEQECQPAIRQRPRADRLARRAREDEPGDALG
jgi:hypothetical protein